MAIKISRAEYEAKFGVKAPTSSPTKITRAEYIQKFGKLPGEAGFSKFVEAEPTRAKQEAEKLGTVGIDNVPLVGSLSIPTTLKSAGQFISDVAPNLPFVGGAVRLANIARKGILGGQEAESAGNTITSLTNANIALQKQIKDYEKRGVDARNLKKIFNDNVDEINKAKSTIGTATANIPTKQQLAGAAGQTMLDVATLGSYGALKQGFKAPGTGKLVKDIPTAAKGAVKFFSKPGFKQAAITTAKELPLAYGYDVALGAQGDRGEDRTGGKAFIPGGITALGALAPVAIKGGTALGNKTAAGLKRVFGDKAEIVSNDIFTSYEKAIKPTIKGRMTSADAKRYKENTFNAISTIVENKPSLKFTDEFGEVSQGRLPESIKDFSESISQTKSKIYDEYDALAKKAGQKGAVVDLTQSTKSLDDVINNQAIQLSNPRTVQYAKNVRDRFLRVGSVDTKTAQDIVQNYNASLEAFYRNPSYESASQAVIDAGLVKMIREQLDTAITSSTGAEYQALKNKYASLKAIEKDVLKRANVYARQNQKGLLDYADIFSGGDMVGGIISLNPALFAKGAAQKGITSYFKWLNNPDRAVKNIFLKAEKNYPISASSAAQKANITFPKNTPNVTPNNIDQNIPPKVPPQTNFGNTGIVDKLKKRWNDTPNKQGGFVRIAPKAKTFADFHPEDQQFLRDFVDKVKAKEPIPESLLNRTRETLESYGFNAPTAKTKLASIIENASNSSMEKSLFKELDAASQKQFKKALVQLENPVDMKTKRELTISDVGGNKVKIPEGSVVQAGTGKGSNMIVEIDGKQYTINKNQFQNLKGQSLVAEARNFAPELEGLEETVKGVVDTTNKTKQQKIFADFDAGKITREERNRLLDELGVGKTKYSQYTLPNGENYREILIQAPETLKKGEYGTDVIDTSKRFRSSHWNEPNVISHLRMNDRTYNGKKVVFMEELQSDWAREARSSNTEATHPLLKNWQEPTIKRALKDAVDNGAEYFAWINGDQTSARYNLATHVKDVQWGKSGTTSGKKIYVNAQSGKDIIIRTNSDGTITKSETVPNDWIGKKLDEVLGKGLADKIMADESGTLSGEGLKFGGEWANNLYDKQVKNIVEDLTGAKVKEFDLGLPIEKSDKKWSILKSNGVVGDGLTPKDLKVGNSITTHPFGVATQNDTYIITDVLGDGKFKAVPKSSYETYAVTKDGYKLKGDYAKEQLENAKETFDISQKQAKQQGIELTPEIIARIKGEAPNFKKKSILPRAELLALMPLIFPFLMNKDTK